MSRLNACDDENKNEFKKMKKIHIFKKNMKFMKKKNAHNITTFYVTLLILHYRCRCEKYQIFSPPLSSPKNLNRNFYLTAKKKCFQNFSNNFFVIA